MKANELIRWGRAFDIKMKWTQEKREANNAVYRRTIRQEITDLHDEDAQALMLIGFMDWLSSKRPRVPTIYID